MHNVTSRQQSNVIMAPTFRPVRRTKVRNYVQTEVKGDSRFLRNENLCCIFECRLKIKFFMSYDSSIKVSESELLLVTRPKIVIHQDL